MPLASQATAGSLATEPTQRDRLRNVTSTPRLACCSPRRYSQAREPAVCRPRPYLHVKAEPAAGRLDQLRQLVDAELLGELVEDAEFAGLGGVVDRDLDAPDLRVRQHGCSVLAAPPSRRRPHPDEGVPRAWRRPTVGRDRAGALDSRGAVAVDCIEAKLGQSEVLQVNLGFRPAGRALAVSRMSR